MRFTAAQAAEAMGARLEGNMEAPILGIALDSRQIEHGDLFVALTGERVDGHRFVDTAVRAGASVLCVRADRREIWEPELEHLNFRLDYTILEVPDTQDALQALAAWYRSQFSIPVVGVTGSVGKTTTKDLTASVLGQRFRVVATRGNMNNELGLPLTLLRLEQETQAAVVEMGMRGLGQIRRLSSLARPTVGVITTIGESHLELLGSREKIAEAKGELLEALPPDGLAVLNGEEPLIMGMRDRTRARVVTFGRAETGGSFDYQVEGIEDRGILGISFTLRWQGGSFPIELGIPGKHNVLNAAAAAAVGLEMGLYPEEVQAGLAGAELTVMRGQILNFPAGVRVVNDAYNASPTSVMAAVDLLAATPGEGRRLAILGDMLELGEIEEKVHRQVGAYAVGQGLAKVAGYGQKAGWIIEGARESGLSPKDTPLFTHPDDAASWLKETLRPGDILLVKGSRGMHMEGIVDLLQKEMDQK